MKIWKISNNSGQYVKVACKTSSMASKGIILESGEFCLSEAQLTSTMDAQERRGFITIDREFDNSKLNLEFVKNYKESELEEMLKNIESETNEEKTDFERAAEMAEKYIKNK